MKTTLVIDDGVMRRLKVQAVRRNTTISSLVEQALRLFLRSSGSTGDLPELPSFDGAGTRINVSNRDELYRAMEGR